MSVAEYILFILYSLKSDTITDVFLKNFFGASIFQDTYLWMVVSEINFSKDFAQGFYL